MIYNFDSEELVRLFHEFNKQNMIMKGVQAFRMVQAVRSIVLEDGRIAEIQIVITAVESEQVLDNDVMRGEIDNDE